MSTFRDTRNRKAMQFSGISFRDVFFGVCGASLGVFSIVGLGISWSCLIVVTLFAVYNVKNSNVVGHFDKKDSFENVYCMSKGESKQKRMLAKKKEKYEKRLKMSSDTNGDEDEDISQNTLPSAVLSESVFEDEDYETVGNYSGVFVNSGYGNKLRQNIPSLKSPQPLLSAFNSRLAKRENILDAQQGNNLAMSPRSVFGNLQNRRLQSPLNTTWTVKEAQLFGNRSLAAHKAMSPPSGRYFSRIRQDFGQDGTFTSPRLESPLKHNSSHDKMNLRTEQLEKTCSKEAVVKALQQKTSKRKRTAHGNKDLVEEDPEQGSKKRRIQNEIFDSTINELSNENMKVDAKQKFLKRSLSSRPSVTKERENTTNDTKIEKDSVQSPEKKNKYGIEENEVSSLSGEENMEVDKRQTKRKAGEQNITPAKGKMNRKQSEQVMSKTDAKQTPKSSKVGKQKKTPVRSVETQTPTKLNEADKQDAAVSSPKTPKTITTPFKKIFTSGFPSNLKPGTTEKRRKIPVYCGSLADIDNIEMGREEYGERGVTCEAFTADRKAAAERALSFIDGEDDEDDAHTQNSKAISSHESKDRTSDASVAGLTPIQKDIASPKTSGVPSSVSQLNSIASLLQPSASPLSSLTTLSSSTIQFGQPVSKTSGAASQTSAEKAPANQSVPDKPFTSNNLNLSSLTNKPSSSDGTNTAFSASSISLAASKLPATAASSSSVSSQGLPASTATITLGTNIQPTAPKLTGGFVPGAQPSNDLSSSTPSFSFGQKLDTTLKQTTLPTSVAQTSTVATSLVQEAKNQPAAPVFGGFNFGVSAGSKQDATASIMGASQPVSSAALLATSANPNTSITNGFSFGKVSGVTQSSFGFGSVSATTVAASASAPVQVSTSSGFGGFSFGTSTTSLSHTSTTSTTSLSGFSFVAKASPPKPTSTSSVTKGVLGGFQFDAGKTTDNKSGGFSFVASQSANTGSANPSVGTALFGAGLPAGSSTGTLFQTPASKDGPIFGSSAASSTASSNPFGSALSLSQKENPLFDAKSQITVQPLPVFGTKTTTQATPIFGAPTQAASTSSSFFTASQLTSSSNSAFGTAVPTTNAAGSLFGQTASNSMHTGSIFGSSTQPASTTSIFGTPSSSASFSLSGQNKPVFGSAPAAQPSAAPGGFSFGVSTQPASSSGTPAVFGQSNATQNPFGGASVFGQTATAPPATTSGGFSFGAATQNAFGQSASHQPAFGASSVFGSSGGQGQAGGFDFSAAAGTAKPTTFAFGASNGASKSGFASRPGTPTPFGTPHPAAGDIFSSPQPQPGGFAMGSGAPNRPTVRGRRRVRK